MSKTDINKLVRLYKNKIKDFKSVYKIRLLDSDIEEMAHLYHEELDIITRISVEEYQNLMSFISSEIETIIQQKRLLGFADNSASGMSLLYTHGMAFEISPPLDLSNDDIETISNSIYLQDPWLQNQPSNDDEFIIHEKWWLDIELYKHKSAYSLFQKNTQSSNDLNIASEWMDSLIKDLVSLSLPQEKDVIKVLSEYYPSFSKEFDSTKLKTGLVRGRKITKSSVAIAVSIIFQQKENRKCTPSAIIKRYNRKQYW